MLIRALISLGLALVLVLQAVTPVAGRFAQPSEAPVERLIQNVTAYTKENPKDPKGFYTLARIHSLALAMKSKQVLFYQWEKALPELNGPIIKWYRHNQDKGPAPTDAELRQHLQSALENYTKALEMEPNNALYHLGLAYTLESGAAVATALPPGFPVTPAPNAAEAVEIAALLKQLAVEDATVREQAHTALKAKGVAALGLIQEHLRTVPPDSQAFARARAFLTEPWLEQSRNEYLKAYQGAIAKDLTITHRPKQGFEVLIGYEAGESYLRLMKGRTPTPAERQQMDEVAEAIKTLKAKPAGAVTPIIFSLDGAAPLRDLLDPMATTRFDLDGTGRGDEWPWVRPQTAVLVWDPEERGTITSGRQLFGSVTWWMFWHDGYHALDALDDNRDGELTGSELKGLSVWRDANSNGVSDSGEVVTASSLTIVALSARATTTQDNCPANPSGVRFADGRTLPTYDWIAKPLDSHVTSRR